MSLPKGILPQGQGASWRLLPWRRSLETWLSQPVSALQLKKKSPFLGTVSG